MESNEREERVGWRVQEWTRAIGGSRSWYYTLRGVKAPRAVSVGSMRIITESPADWLRRVGAEAPLT